MISIVIPAYNEEGRISTTLLKINDYMKGKSEEFEIIVVNDGSSDNTQQAVTKTSEKIPSIKLINYTRNMGKGFAVRKGVLASSGEIILISDADLSTPIEEIDKLIPKIDYRSGGTCAVAIGSRALPESQLIIKQPWWRQFMGKIFNRLVRLLVIKGFTDTQCGFKLFDGAAARQIFSMAKVNRFAYDVEALLLAKQMGFGIKEFPVKWLNSADSKVNPVTDSLQMLKDIIKIRLLLPKKNLTFVENTIKIIVR